MARIFQGPIQRFHKEACNHEAVSTLHMKRFQHRTHEAHTQYRGIPHCWGAQSAVSRIPTAWNCTGGKTTALPKYVGGQTCIEENPNQIAFLPKCHSSRHTRQLANLLLKSFPGNRTCWKPRSKGHALEIRHLLVAQGSRWDQHERGRERDIDR